MFQASQRAVAHTANINLVNIRNIELDYFSTFFTNFGTISFVLTGFICGAISQTPAFQSGTHYFWQLLYNISSATCVAFGTLGLLGSVFIVMFGNGLALRGPPGSMVKTIENMVIEQHNMVAIFVGTVFFYVLQEIGMCVIMMDMWVALVSCSCIILIGIYTYHVSLRIYNRFYWDSEQVEWIENQNDPLDELSQSSPNKLPRQSPSNLASKRKVKEQSVFTIFMNNLTGHKKNKHSTDNNVPLTPNNADMYDGVSVTSETPYVDLQDSKGSSKGKAPTVAQPETVNALHQNNNQEQKNSGYLSLYTRKTFGDPWERKFFVLRNQLMFYYKDKRSFQLDPAKPINTRPIDLEGYTLVAGAVEPPYAISLVPLDPDDIRKAWKFRCDTVSEFNQWVECFKRVIMASQNFHESDAQFVNAAL